MNIYHEVLSWSVTASTEATGYDADYLINQSIRQPWRSADTLETTITIDLTQSLTPAAIMLQGANFNDCDLEYSADNVSYTKLTDLTLYRDALGPESRYKGLYANTQAARYFRIKIPSGTPKDGMAYWSLSTIYIWGSSANNLCAMVGTNIEWEYPQRMIPLPSGKAVVVETGSIFASINLQFLEEYSDDAALVIRLSRLGIVGLDLGSDRTWDVWPVRYYDPGFNYSFQEPTIANLSPLVREVV